MADSYKILYGGGEAETEVKKSRFIATVRPVKTEAEITGKTLLYSWPVCIGRQRTAWFQAEPMVSAVIIILAGTGRSIQGVRVG